LEVLKSVPHCAALYHLSKVLSEHHAQNSVLLTPQDAVQEGVVVNQVDNVKLTTFVQDHLWQTLMAVMHMPSTLG